MKGGRDKNRERERAVNKNQFQLCLHWFYHWENWYSATDLARSDTIGEIDGPPFLEVKKKTNKKKPKIGSINHQKCFVYNVPFTMEKKKIGEKEEKNCKDDNPSVQSFSFIASVLLKWH